MEASLLDLPDDALLAVLAYLPPTQLLTSRGACRRLRDLCLHPDLWRSVRLRDVGSSKPLLAALRLTPCVREVDLSCTHFITSAAAVVASTTCVTRSLVVGVLNDDRLPFAMAALKKFSALGGLRKLEIRNIAIPYEDMRPLLRMVFSVASLHELTINIIMSRPSLSVSWTGLEERSASLKKVTYHAEGADSFLEALLKTHATTLEKVAVWLAVDDSVPVSLLNNIPKLRSLACYRHDDLCQLQAAPQLDTLELSATGREVLSGASPWDFLRRTSQLRSVTLTLMDSDAEAPLIALGESRSARLLENLYLKNAWFASDRLACALQQFPSLRLFDLGAVPSPSFLRAVSPQSAPSLHTLIVRYAEDTWCIHAWIHAPAIQDVLARNSGLHLRSKPSRRSFAERCPSCQWCESGCHSEWRGSKVGAAFSSHTRRAGCPRDCLQVIV